MRTPEHDYDAALQDYEDRAALDCGCVLQQRPIPAIWFCPMHDAAADVRAALEGLVEQLDGIGIPEWHGAEGLDLTAARAVLDPRQGGTA